MDHKIELVAIPVTDVDRAKAFYVDRVGFHDDRDHRVSDELRVVQLTPPGSAARSSSATASPARCRRSWCRGPSPRGGGRGAPPAR